MLHYGTSSGIISDNKLIHLSLCYKSTYLYVTNIILLLHSCLSYIQGCNELVQGGSSSPGTEITTGTPL